MPNPRPEPGRTWRCTPHSYTTKPPPFDVKISELVVDPILMDEVVRFEDGSEVMLVQMLEDIPGAPTWRPVDQ